MADTTWPHTPWFLNADSPLTYPGGQFSREQLETAARELTRLYPLNVAYQLLNDDADFLVTPLLIAGFAWHLAPKILLGLDLAAADPWTAAPDLVERLRIGPEYHGARFELEVWAQLHRAGMSVEYAPEGRLGGADLRVRHRDRVYRLELKLGRAPDVDRFIHAFIQGFMDSLTWYHFEHPTSPNGECIEMAPAIRKRLFERGGLEELIARREEILEGMVSAYQKWHSEGAAPGSHPIGEFAIVHRPGCTPGAFSVSFGVETSPEKAAARALRNVRKATRQVTPDGTGVVVVDVERNTDPEVFVSRLQSEALARPSDFARVQFVIVRTHARLEDGCLATHGAVVPLLGYTMRREDRELAGAVFKATSS
ncbi:MAG TPA: hypothetical protein VG389_13035 [Myxococcota bacterium]|jgi:hypothetical protein|nr:hypothetical protein [Myxococcota bacterium]